MDIEKIRELCEEACIPKYTINQGTYIATYFKPEKEFAEKILELLDEEEPAKCQWLKEYNGKLMCTINMPDSILDCPKDGTCPYEWGRN